MSDEIDIYKQLTDDEFIKLVSSTSEQEWNAACDEVKKARQGAYPSEWFQRMMVSGLMRKVAATWGGTDEVKIK